MALSQEEHAQLVADALVALTHRAGTMAWKHPTGVGVTRSRSIVRFGLTGSGDIIGCSRMLITPDMVGRSFGQAFALDAKTGRAEQSGQQKRFQAAWERAGGLYCIIRSVEDALAAVDPARVLV